MFVYAMIWLFILAASLTTISAFAWWMKSGGMRGFELQGRAIFSLRDEDMAVEDGDRKSLSTRGN